VIEINPVIPKVAREYFGSLQNGEKIFITDGRNFINSIDRQYDFIIVDTSNLDTVPYHLYSKNFFSEAATKLAPGGIIAMNTLGTPDGGQFESVQVTLKSVFDYVRVFRAHTRPTFGNAIFFASKMPLILSSKDEAKYKADETQFKGKGIVLTDNYNPIDIMSAKVGIAVRNYY
jgi:spermidine synthase